MQSGFNIILTRNYMYIYFTFTYCTLAFIHLIKIEMFILRPTDYVICSFVIITQLMISYRHAFTFFFTYAIARNVWICIWS